MKRLRTRQIVFPALVILAVSTAGCSLQKNQYAGSSPVLEATADPEDVFYNTVTVQRGDQEEKTEVNFVLKPKKSVNLFFGVADIEYEKVYVGENSHVKKGDLIVQLDMDDLEEKLKEYKNEIDAKELELTHQKNMLALEQQRAPVLKESERKEYQKNVKKTQDNIKFIQDELKMLKENIKQNKIAKEKRCIYAPFDGVVKNILDINQERVSVRRKSFAEFYDDTMKFQNSSEKNYGFKAGQVFDVYINDSPYKATVTDVKQADGKTVTSLKLNNGSQFEENTLAVRYIKGAEFHNSLYVESKAVFLLDGKPALYTLDEYGIKKVTKITTGVKANGYTEIKTGVKEGEQVVLE